jgi:hypothetical protein
MLKTKAVPQQIPQQIEPVAFDIPSAARFLSATEWAVRRLIYAGKLAYKRAGKRIIIPRVVLEEYATTGLVREGTGRKVA